MPRKIDTPGEITDPRATDVPAEPEDSSLRIEIPLWRFGTIKLTTRSQKASLAIIALCVITFLMLVLSGIESLPGLHPGLTAVLTRLGDALMLALGVLLGVDWAASKKD